MTSAAATATGEGTAPPTAASGPDTAPAIADRLPGWAARQTRGWLWAAIAAVAILAAASAAASWNAQFTAVSAVRHPPVIAAIEAGIPDAGALFFACLGIALALHGRRAVRPRALNACCVAVSLTMNALASAPSWRDIAIWVMPSAMYAVASDTLIGVIRAFTAQYEEGPLAKLRRGVAALVLCTLRLLLAFPSTFSGFRQWVMEEGPVAPGRKASPTAASKARRGSGKPAAGKDRAAQPSKQQLMITAAGRLADLKVISLDEVPKVAAEAAGEVGLHPGTARRQLRQYVLDLQQGRTGDVNGKALV